MERKDYKFTFPFEPPWEDLKMEVTTSTGAKAYIFDTCVRRDPEERAAIDREVAGVLMRHERRRFMEKLAREEREKGNEIPPPPSAALPPS